MTGQLSVLSSNPQFYCNVSALLGVTILHMLKEYLRYRPVTALACIQDFLANAFPTVWHFFSVGIVNPIQMV
jgi:hypothetical protein